MVEINLLPWREYARAKKRSLQKFMLSASICLGVILLVVSVIIFRHFSLDSPPQNPLADAPQSEDAQFIQQIQKIKFIGFLQQGHRQLGIVKLDTGEIRDVKIGSLIRENVLVTGLTAAEIILQVSDNTSLKIPFTGQ
jgi:hypothetical protein